MDMQALFYRFAGLFYEFVGLKVFSAGLQICRSHFELCIMGLVLSMVQTYGLQPLWAVGHCRPMQNAGPMNFSIRWVCIALLDASLFADFK